MYKELMFDRPYYGTPEHYYNEYLRKHQKNSNKGQRGKDTERQKTYNAEFAFIAKHGQGIEFSDVSEAQKYVTRICKSKTYGKLFVEAYESREGMGIEELFRGTKVRVSAKERNTGRGTAGMAYRGHIVLDTRVGLNEYTVLHELAHCLGHWHHGRSFRQALVKLVSRFMGTESATLLKESFKESKLSYGNARKPQTFEQWTAARERMSQMRESKSL